MDDDSVIYQSICDGSSKITLGGITVYIRHPKLGEQAVYKELYTKSFENYKSRGTPTDAEADQMLIDSGVWTEEDNKEMEILEAEIENLKATAKAELLPSRVIGINRKIDKFKAALNEKRTKKLSLRPITCELGANLKVNDHIIVGSFYKDFACTIKYFSQEDYENLERSKIEELTQIYVNCMAEIDEKRVQVLALSDFFSPMFTLFTSPNDFFGKAVVHLTRAQLVLCFYVKIFKNIFENIPKIPKNILKDPDALLQYAENYNPSTGESKSSHAKNSDVGGTTWVGATKEDLEALKKDGDTVVNIGSLAKKAMKDGETSVRMMDVFNLQS